MVCRSFTVHSDIFASFLSWIACLSLFYLISTCCQTNISSLHEPKIAFCHQLKLIEWPCWWDPGSHLNFRTVSSCPAESGPGWKDPFPGLLQRDFSQLYFSCLFVFHKAVVDAFLDFLQVCCFWLLKIRLIVAWLCILWPHILWSNRSESRDLIYSNCLSQ